jgi:hypothetical protein
VFQTEGVVHQVQNMDLGLALFGKQNPVMNRFAAVFGGLGDDENSFEFFHDACPFELEIRSAVESEWSDLPAFLFSRRPSVGMPRSMRSVRFYELLCHSQECLMAACIRRQMAIHTRFYFRSSRDAVISTRADGHHV